MLPALPTHDPIIHGLQPTYGIGDFLIANCTTDRSSPAASLLWYIDDEKVRPQPFLDINKRLLYAYTVSV